MPACPVEQDVANGASVVVPRRAVSVHTASDGQRLTMTVSEVRRLRESRKEASGLSDVFGLLSTV